MEIAVLLNISLLKCQGFIFDPAIMCYVYKDFWVLKMFITGCPTKKLPLEIVRFLWLILALCYYHIVENHPALHPTPPTPHPKIS